MTRNVTERAMGIPNQILRKLRRQTVLLNCAGVFLICQVNDFTVVPIDSMCNCDPPQNVLGQYV